MEILRYEVVKAATSSDLAERVNRRIEIGWQPLGGVSVSAWNVGSMEYAQAVVLHDKDNA